jgi:hypothetical protein
MKAIYAVSSVDFLGHTVSVRGIKPTTSHAAALLQQPHPATVKQLQALLGLINFHRRFILAAARMLKPLTN